MIDFQVTDTGSFLSCVVVELQFEKILHVDLNKELVSGGLPVNWPSTQIDLITARLWHLFSPCKTVVLQKKSLPKHLNTNKH